MGLIVHEYVHDPACSLFDQMQDLVMGNANNHKTRLNRIQLKLTLTE